MASSSTIKLQVIERSEGLRVIKEKYNSAVTVWQSGQSFMRYVFLYVKECLQKFILNMSMFDLHFMKNCEAVLQSIFFWLKRIRFVRFAVSISFSVQFPPQFLFAVKLLALFLFIPDKKSIVLLILLIFCTQCGVLHDLFLYVNPPPSPPFCFIVTESIWSFPFKMKFYSGT